MAQCGVGICWPGGHRRGPASHANRAISAGRGLGLFAFLARAAGAHPQSPQIRTFGQGLARGRRDFGSGKDVGRARHVGRRRPVMVAWHATLGRRHSSDHMHPDRHLCGQPPLAATALGRTAKNLTQAVKLIEIAIAHNQLSAIGISAMIDRHAHAQMR